jgi:hypothetical protein
MRRFAGGGSVDPQHSTELLVDSRLKTTTARSGTGPAGFQMGCQAGPVWWLRPGKCPSLFFCFNSFLLFPIFCFDISNPNLLFCFCRFELVTCLQALEFEITYQI